ncbi:MAG: hypothetical protein AB4290_01245 [Spirulina sp.]
MIIPKKRHGCLTAWLIFMLLGNSIATLMYLLAAQTIRQAFPAAPSWAFPLLTVVAIFNLICTIALFNWKKWGFWGLVGSSITTFIVNLSIGVSIGQALFGLIGIVLLYGVLNIGEQNKGWSQLD